MLVFLPFGMFIALTTFAQPLLEPAGVSGSTASLLLLGNVVAGVAGCVLLAAAPGTVTGLLVLLAIGFLLLPTLPVVLELTERGTAEVQGTAAGLIWLSGNLGGLVIATTVGLLVDHPLAAFLTMATVALLAIPLVGPLRPYLSRSSAMTGMISRPIRVRRSVSQTRGM